MRKCAAVKCFSIFYTVYAKYYRIRNVFGELWSRFKQKRIWMFMKSVRNCCPPLTKIAKYLPVNSQISISMKIHSVILNFLYAGRQTNGKA
jgi:hypothetical protein